MIARVALSWHAPLGGQRNRRIGPGASASCGSAEQWRRQGTHRGTGLHLLQAVANLEPGPRCSRDQGLPMPAPEAQEAPPASLRAQCHAAGLQLVILREGHVFLTHGTGPSGISPRHFHGACVPGAVVHACGVAPGSFQFSGADFNRIRVASLGQILGGVCAQHCSTWSAAPGAASSRRRCRSHSHVSHSPARFDSCLGKSSIEIQRQKPHADIGNSVSCAAVALISPESDQPRSVTDDGESDRPRAE